jgi:hypothetical protein
MRPSAPLRSTKGFHSVKIGTKIEVAAARAASAPKAAIPYTPGRINVFDIERIVLISISGGAAVFGYFQNRS